LSLSFSSASRSWSYSLASSGTGPANTCGWISLKPGRRLFGGAEVVRQLLFQRDRVADLGGLQLLDAGDDRSRLARIELVAGLGLGENTPRLSAG